MASSDDEVGEALDVATARMLSDEGVRPDQITILSGHRSQVEDLRSRTLGGGSPVCDLDDDGIVTETIHRYKASKTTSCS